MFLAVLDYYRKIDDSQAITRRSQYELLEESQVKVEELLKAVPAQLCVVKLVNMYTD